MPAACPTLPGCLTPRDCSIQLWGNYAVGSLSNPPTIDIRARGNVTWPTAHLPPLHYLRGATKGILPVPVQFPIRNKKHHYEDRTKRLQRRQEHRCNDTYSGTRMHVTHPHTHTHAPNTNNSPFFSEIGSVGVRGCVG